MAVFACAIIAAAFSFSGCGGSSSDDGDDGKFTIVCLGDSLTAGMSATTVGEDDASKSYPAYLKAKLTDDADVVNSGVSGDTTDQALARFKEDVLDKDPGIVIICLGANDLFGSTNAEIADGSAVTKIKNNIINMIQQLDTDDRLVFVAKFYSEESAKKMLNDEGITDTATQDDIIDDLNTAFEEIKNTSTTKLSDIELIEDIWTGVWGINMSTDGIHPVASGYETMANTYFEYMREILEEFDLVK